MIFPGGFKVLVVGRDVFDQMMDEIAGNPQLNWIDTFQQAHELGMDGIIYHGTPVCFSDVPEQRGFQYWQRFKIWVEGKNET